MEVSSERKFRYESLRRYYQNLAPMVNSLKNRTYTAAIFSFIAAALFGWYAIRPTVKTILFLKREIKDKIVVNQKMEEKINSLIEAQATYESAQNQLPDLDEALPETSEAIELVRELRNVALLSSASISAIQIQAVPIGEEATPGGKTAKKQTGEFTITMVASGTYTTIRSVLNTIVSLRRIVTVDTLTITPERQGPGPSTGGLLQLVIKVKSYFTGS